jgi:hypothetical protein
MRKILLLAILCMLVTGCTYDPRPMFYRDLGQSDSLSVAEKLENSVRTCWFGKNNNRFEDLAPVSELDSLSQRPRILIVKRSNPEGRPLLVVDTEKASDGFVKVGVYGPLLETRDGGYIRKQVDLWKQGIYECA